jgi:hypothetical protein
MYRPDEVTSVTKEVLPDGQLTEVNTYTSTSLRNYMTVIARLDV